MRVDIIPADLEATVGPRPAVVNEFARFVERFTYKPGFYAQVIYDKDLVRLAIIGPEPDASQWLAALDGQPVRLIPIVNTHTISRITLEHSSPSPRRDEHWKWIVQTTILQYERHEMDEWLRLDGEQIVNPHPKVSPS